MNNIPSIILSWIIIPRGFFKLITKRSSAKFLLVYCRPFFKKKRSCFFLFFFSVVQPENWSQPKKKKKEMVVIQHIFFSWLPFSGEKKETRLLSLWVKHLKKNWLKCCNNNNNNKNDYNNQKKLLKLIFIKYLISMVQKNILEEKKVNKSIILVKIKTWINK